MGCDLQRSPYSRKDAPPAGWNRPDHTPGGSFYVVFRRLVTLIIR